MMPSSRSLSWQRRQGQKGAATLVVLVLLFLMVAFIAGNSIALHSLKRDLHMLERRQLQKYQLPTATNSLALPGPRSTTTAR